MTRPCLTPAARAAFRDLSPAARLRALALKLQSRRAAAGLKALEALAPLELAALQAGRSPVPDPAAAEPDEPRYRLCKRIARRALAGELSALEGTRCHGLWAAPRWARDLRLLAERDGLVFYEGV
ncbi:MAG: hypothetical protein WEA84_14340 [Rhodovibrionaceae bacterium]